ncbi:MAG TPA: xanthine dehydrogenase family protein molybdopterin-binding subunit, partial [Rhodospirillales bacterium]
MKSADLREFKVVGKRNLRPDGVDKVTGRAKYGADLILPGMLYGRVLRSPHAHAIIKKIDISKAAKLPGVKAIVTRDDFPDQPKSKPPYGPIVHDLWDATRNIMAREKALYDGHPVAAVAAVSDSIAKQALKLIKVDYQVLPHVINPVEAMAADAPILHEHQLTIGVDPAPTKPSNVFRVLKAEKGDLAKGFAEADVIVEREFNTKAVHQGYIEPHACVASASEDGNVELWCTTQGQFVSRNQLAALLGLPVGKIRVTSSEIGGGFGGKIPIYGEPLAIRLSQKANRPVKIIMTREETFRSTGPTSGANVHVKMGARKDGRICAADVKLVYEAGAFKGSGIGAAIGCCLSEYDLENVKITGYDVVSNRPKVAAYRAPGVPMAAYGVESVINELADRLKIDTVDIRLKNAAKQGTVNAAGIKYGPIGFIELLEKVKEHPHYKAPLKKNQGRGFACGYWMHAGGMSCASLNVQDDGTVTLIEGNPDIGGSRASMCAMAAEELGIPFDKVRPIIADTSSLGFTFLTAGSRVTYATGMAVVEATRNAIKVCCERAAAIWGVTPE